MKRLGVLLLAMCRTLYCLVFLFWSFCSVDIAFVNIRRAALAHVVDRGAIGTSTIFPIYAAVFGIAWWTILRGKPTSKRWAIAANLFLIFFYLPVEFLALIFWGWRGLWDWREGLRDELEWWPFILIGIFGIIIFSIPYHGWRRDHLDEMARSTPTTS